MADESLSGRWRLGYGIAYFKGHLNHTAFARAHYATAHAAWIRGEPFITVEDCWGDRVTLKLGEVCIMAECTPEGRRRWLEDDTAERIEDLRRDKHIEMQATL